MTRVRVLLSALVLAVIAACTVVPSSAPSAGTTSVVPAAVSTATPTAVKTPIVKATAPPPSQLKAATNCTVTKDAGYTATQKTDGYVPSNGKTANPTIILIHGGAWVGGDKATFAPLANLLCRKGWTVFVPNYTLAGVAPWPAQIKDLRTMVRGARAAASYWHVWTPKVAAVGVSAGGHLAEILGLAGGTHPEWDGTGFPGYSSAVAAVTSDAGPTDLIGWATAHPEYQGAVGQLFGTAWNDPAKGAELNPITYINAGDPPIYLRHGDQDTLVAISHSQNVYDAQRAAGIPGAIHIVGGMGHADLDWWTTAWVDEMSGQLDAVIR